MAKDWNNDGLWIGELMMTMAHWPYNLIWALPFMFLVGVFIGCAAPLLLPCEFDLRVRVDKPGAVDEDCHDLGSVDHAGRKVPRSRRIRGCAPAWGIITDSSSENIAHEVKHHIDRNCRKSD